MEKGLTSLINRVITIRDFIFDLLFPIECVGCGREEDWLCPDCFKSLGFSRAQYCLDCKRCSAYGRFCTQCQPRHYLDGVLIVGDYENRILAEIIKNLKYRMVRGLAAVLGELSCRFLENMLKRQYFMMDVKSKTDAAESSVPKIFDDLRSCRLIPVPLHRKRMLWRGFNQAEEIGRVIAGNLNLEMSRQELIRTKNRVPQAKLKEKDRIDNVKGCFAWQGHGLNGQTVILLDDVVTTGATLDECARVLRDNGAGEIWGLVIAKG